MGTDEVVIPYGAVENYSGRGKVGAIKEIIILDSVVGDYSGKRYKILRERLNKDGSKTVRLKPAGWMSVQRGDTVRETQVRKKELKDEPMDKN